MVDRKIGREGRQKDERAEPRDQQNHEKPQPWQDSVRRGGAGASNNLPSLTTKAATDAAKEHMPRAGNTAKEPLPMPSGWTVAVLLQRQLSYRSTDYDRQPTILHTRLELQRMMLQRFPRSRWIREFRYQLWVKCQQLTNYLMPPNGSSFFIPACLANPRNFAYIQPHSG